MILTFTRVILTFTRTAFFVSRRELVALSVLVVPKTTMIGAWRAARTRKTTGGGWGVPRKEKSSLRRPRVLAVGEIRVYAVSDVRYDTPQDRFEKVDLFYFFFVMTSNQRLQHRATYSNPKLRPQNRKIKLPNQNKKQTTPPNQSM